MFDSCDLHKLNAWCDDRQLIWTAASPDGVCPAMLLEPVGAGRAWQRLLLVLAEPDLRLENELGETLASASALPALLDALDGGLADKMPLTPRENAAVAAARTGFGAMV